LPDNQIYYRHNKESSNELSLTVCGNF